MFFISDLIGFIYKIIIKLSDELILYIRMQFTYEIREGRRKRVLSAAGSLDAAGDCDLDCDEDTNSSVFPLRVVTRGIYGILLPVGGELGCLQKGALCSDISIGQGGTITWKVLQYTLAYSIVHKLRK
uniref:Uncharacterized protein n=1 Tax=Lactuca sativa TaxID=4236 RepID=A0A9R1WSE1_LACSA|nr:hypothetical protein LSAT_V11C900475190 [Lactuca sativa]